MRKLEFKIAAGLGDNLVLRMALDTIKHDYDQIRISHNKMIVNDHRNGDPLYFKFLADLGNLIFTEPPYIFDQGDYPEIYTYDTYKRLGIKIKEPRLDYLLCKGDSLNLGEEYIVITTRARSVIIGTLSPLLPSFWKLLDELSQKYKIVILGEREVQGVPDHCAGTKDDVFSIYDQIKLHIPAEKILDLTVPALGITAPDLIRIQQDCLIMKEAKTVITFGIGGNVWMAAAVANTTGYRSLDENNITDIIINPEFRNIFITQDWTQFIVKLEGYK